MSLVHTIPNNEALQTFIADNNIGDDTTVMFLSYKQAHLLVKDIQAAANSPEGLIAIVVPHDNEV
jgi:hypothetical protein